MYTHILLVKVLLNIAGRNVKYNDEVDGKNLFIS